MLTNPRTDPPPDPDALLVGKCQTCGLVLEMPRYQARTPTSGGLVGHWNDDTYTAECPGFQGRWHQGTPVTCGARVQLREKILPE